MDRSGTCESCADSVSLGVASVLPVVISLFLVTIFWYRKHIKTYVNKRLEDVKLKFVVKGTF